jgi:long-chain acyl-CoA synthetase
MAGYLDYATLQPQPLERETFFPSGDLGHLDADRQLFITGRKKDIIIKGGINVSPRAVEEVLLEHESVEQVAVVGLPHDFYGEQVVAALQLRSGRQLAAEISSLKALCASRLGVDSIPSRFVAVAALPANANGKIQKNVLREILLNEARPDASTEKVKT